MADITDPNMGINGYTGLGATRLRSTDTASTPSGKDDTSYTES